jgi:hypothetical protein
VRRDMPARWRAAAAIALTAALFVPLLILGGPAFAHIKAAASEYEYGGSSQYQYQSKVTLCHRTHSRKHPWVIISIAAAAVPAHTRLGDVPPPCPTTPASTTGHGHGNPHSSGSSSDTSTGTPSTEHGNSGSAPGHSAGHGKG